VHSCECGGSEREKEEAVRRRGRESEGIERGKDANEVAKGSNVGEGGKRTSRVVAQLK
jgi:hypothetical protein